MLPGPAAAEFPAARYAAAVTVRGDAGSDPPNWRWSRTRPIALPAGQATRAAWGIELVLPKKRVIQSAFDCGGEGAVMPRLAPNRPAAAATHADNRRRAARARPPTTYTP